MRVKAALALLLWLGLVAGLAAASNTYTVRVPRVLSEQALVRVEDKTYTSVHLSVRQACSREGTDALEYADAQSPPALSRSLKEEEHYAVEVPNCARGAVVASIEMKLLGKTADGRTAEYSCGQDASAIALDSSDCCDMRVAYSFASCEASDLPGLSSSTYQYVFNRTEDAAFAKMCEGGQARARQWCGADGESENAGEWTELSCKESTYLLRAPACGEGTFVAQYALEWRTNTSSDEYYTCFGRSTRGLPDPASSATEGETFKGNVRAFVTRTAVHECEGETDLRYADTPADKRAKEQRETDERDTNGGDGELHEEEEEQQDNDEGDDEKKSDEEDLQKDVPSDEDTGVTEEEKKETSSNEEEQEKQEKVLATDGKDQDGEDELRYSVWNGKGTYIRRNRLLANAPMHHLGTYSFSFWLQPRGYHHGWSSVLHHGDSNSYRTPAVFVHSDTTRLHVCSAATTAWQICVNPSQSLPMYRWTHVTVTHTSGLMEVLYNGTSVGTVTGHGAPVWRGGSIRAGNPWYRAYPGLVADIRFARRVFSPEMIKDIMDDEHVYDDVPERMLVRPNAKFFKLKQGLQFENAKTSMRGRDRTFAFWIRPDAGHNAWTNIFHHGAHNSHRCGAVWFYPGQTRLHIRSSSDSSSDDGHDPGEHLPMYQWTHVAFRHTRMDLTVVFNGTKVFKHGGIHNPADYCREAPLYLSDPWHPPAAAELYDFRFYNVPLSNEELKEVYEDGIDAIEEYHEDFDKREDSVDPAKNMDLVPYHTGLTRSVDENKYEKAVVYKWRHLCVVSGTVRGYPWPLYTLPHQCRPYSGTLIFSTLKGGHASTHIVYPNGYVYQWYSHPHYHDYNAVVELAGMTFTTLQGPYIHWHGVFTYWNQWWRGATISYVKGLCLLEGFQHSYYWWWWWWWYPWFGHMSDSRCQVSGGNLLFRNNYHSVTGSTMLERHGSTTYVRKAMYNEWYKFGAYPWSYWNSHSGFVYTPDAGGAALNLDSNWVHHQASGLGDNHYRRGSYKRHGPVCVLDGVVYQTGNLGHETRIAVLPSGCRPRKTLVFPGTTGGWWAHGGNNRNSRITVHPDGRLMSADQRYVTLSGVNFIAYN